MARPDVFIRTYDSFRRNLLGIDWKNSKIYLNVDPMPSSGLVSSVIDAAKEYFGTVIVRSPKNASFPAAVEWWWKTVEEGIYLHLEDDWVLTKKISIKYLVRQFQNKDIQQVIIRAYSRGYRKMCLSPSVIRSDFAKKFTFNHNLNPEIQLRTQFVKRKNICCPFVKKNVLVKDIGREWIENKDFRKPKAKCDFTSWEKK